MPQTGEKDMTGWPKEKVLEILDIVAEYGYLSVDAVNRELCNEQIDKALASITALHEKEVEMLKELMQWASDAGDFENIAWDVVDRKWYKQFEQALSKKEG